MFQAEGRASAKPSRQNVAGRCEKWLEQSQEGEAGGTARGDGRGRRKGSTLSHKGGTEDFEQRRDTI